jgi:cob(I)alamin adenosyltransferase
MEPALIQVYTGPGKGKTTAAIGLIVRALGQGLQVLLVRFLKPHLPVSGELIILSQLSGLEIVTSGLGGIGAQKTPELLRQNIAETMTLVNPKILSGAYDLVVLDEFNAVLHKNYLPLEAGLQLLEQRPLQTELVLTGRNAPQAIIEQADLVTRMEADRHPFAQGISARLGIEY